ncbi:MAG: ATP-binding protein [Rubrivivax sp.]|jgi:signal transduction histidine kinase/CheY-like chemotaxis protein|nr:response regulator [Rubrivivax sp.]MCA3256683.1 response regulator [Rubrivivax sp.]MCZ8029129.1 ATP-binding protein [Rubrivivax sp.]
MPARPAPTDTPQPAEADGIEPRVRAEQIAQLYETTPVPALTGVPFAAILAAIAWDLAAPAVLLGWLLTKFALAAVRSTEVLRFRADPTRAQRADYWSRRYLLLALVDALSWGAVVHLFVLPASGLTMALLLCGVVAVAALGMFMTASHLPAGLVWNVATLGPPGITFAMQGGGIGWAVAASAAIYSGLLAFEAWRNERRLAEMLRLRFQNAAIAEERARALLAAEASSSAKTRFLASVSHEMRTPLNGILGMAEVVRAELQDPVQRHRLDTLARSALHLNRVIGDLLDFSTIEFERLQMHPEVARLAALVGEVGDLLGPAARERGLRLHVERLPGLPAWVLVDASRVKQVLHNLIGNAIKFTPSGEVRVRVERPSVGRLAFSVRDSGPGIAAADQERIFDAFERLSATGHVPGSGLGLAIARRLARAMGGDVTCSSTPGEGACFVFTLAAPEAAAPAASPRQDELPSGLLQGCRVLVVDDNEVNAVVARSMLELMGATIEAACNGEEALERLAHGHFDVVLMDCQMPVLDGFEATRRWRARERERGGRRLPIVGVTANASPADRAACHDAGMDAHLAKPYRIADLAATLRQVRSARAPLDALQS